MAGSCAPTCDTGWGTCDGNAANGCERSLTTVTDCGACDLACTNPHGGTACVASLCAPTCDTGWGTCDANAANGCERSLTTLTDCSACDVACNLANASESCSTGTCTITSCSAGFSNCDGNQATGCEVQHSGYSNAPPGVFLGTWDADAATGFLCPSQACSLAVTQTGNRGRYLYINAHEGSACCAYVALRVELIVPSGADYDLYVSGSPFCDPFGCSSTQVGNDTITAWANDDCSAADNSFTLQIEVRYHSGASCQPWTLNVYRRGC